MQIKATLDVDVVQGTLVQALVALRQHLESLTPLNTDHGDQVVLHVLDASVEVA